MFKVKMAPDEYVRGVGIISKVGQYAAELGHKALVVGGRRALDATEGLLTNAFREMGTEFEIKRFQGHCSQTNIAKYRDELIQGGFDLLIGVGGGRIMDCVKAAANAAGKPLINIPTIVATCAAWTPLSIIYSDEGVYENNLNLSHNPMVVVADLDVISKAPARYLAAGIGDSLAKWYEVRLNASTMAKIDLSVQASIKLADLCNRTLLENGLAAVEAVRQHSINEALERIVDTTVLLVGLISGLAGDAGRLAVGHAIYNCLSNFRSADICLHGEKVAFGVAVQLVLQDEPESEVASFLSFLKSLGLPTKLADLGIREAEERRILLDLVAANNALITAPFDGSRENIEQAIATVERLAG